MRKLIFVLLISPLLSYGQDFELPFDSITKKVSFVFIEKVDSVTQDVLFSRALIATSKVFNSAKSVIEVSDKSSGIIVIKAVFISYTQGMFGENVEPGDRVTYAVRVYIKNGKYKIEITDFTVNFTAASYELPFIGKPQGITKPISYWNRTREKAKENAEIIADTFKKEMAIESTKDDW